MSFSNVQQSDLLYFDLLITNVDTLYKDPRPVYFNETRSTPFLYSPEDYEMSVVRFTMDTQTLPVFIPTIMPAGPLNNNYPDINTPTGNPNKTIYSVSMTYGENTVETYIIFSPEDTTAPAPQVLLPNQPQDNTNGYYNIYSYEYFIKLVNNALYLCFEQLKTTLSPITLPTSNAPLIIWNTNNTATMVVDSAGFSPFIEGGAITLTFNPALAQLFSTFNYYTINTEKNPAIDAFKSFQFIFTTVAQETNITTITFPDSGLTDGFASLQVTQESSTIVNWNPIISLVFTSNTLPIIPTQVTQPLLYIDGAVQFATTANNNNISNVITDFSSDGGLKPYIYYVPTAEFRMISLVGNRPLNNIDVGVFYKIKTGTLIPFKLAAGGSASIKILFRKKGDVNK